MAGAAIPIRFAINIDDAKGITAVGGSVSVAEAFVKRQLEQWIPVAEKAQMQVD